MSTSFFQSALRELFPSPADPKIPLNSSNWHILALPSLINFVLAFLSRWPDTTQKLRLLLLPLAVLINLQGFRYTIAGEGYYAYSLAIGWATISHLAKAFDYTFSKQLQKVGKDLSKPRTSNENKTYMEALSEANELMSASRGIGFEFGKSIPIPKETRPLERGPFLIATFFWFLKLFIMFDIIEFTLKFTQPLRATQGGSIFIQSLPLPQRIVFSTFTHILTGGYFMIMFQLSYVIPTLIFVGIFNQSPSLWPPVFDRVWMSTSLQYFWGRGWQQLIRRTFLVLGGFPCRWLGETVGLGRIGLLFGTFLASGLFHEIPCYLVDGHFDWRLITYFVSQAFLICLENAWTAITGRKVGGRWGNVWVIFNILFLSQYFSDSWHMRGLVDGVIYYSKISPCRRIVLPILNDYFGSTFYLKPGY